MLNNHLLDAFTQIISMGFSIVIKFSHDEKLSKGMMFIMYQRVALILDIVKSSFHSLLHLIKSDILKIFVTKVFVYLKFFATLSIIIIISSNLINQKIHFYDEMMLIKGVN